jgi:hypothetical protein
MEAEGSLLSVYWTALRHVAEDSNPRHIVRHCAGNAVEKRR